MQVKYIGDHVKTDSIPGVGLRWEPGQQRDVTSTVAAHLLAYPDTWVKGDSESDKSVKSQKNTRVEAADKEEPIGFLEEDERPEEPLAVVNFHDMDKDQLLDYGAKNLNVRLNKNWSEHVIREHIVKHHTKKQMEG